MTPRPPKIKIKTQLKQKHSIELDSLKIWSSASALPMINSVHLDKSLLQVSVPFISHSREYLAHSMYSAIFYYFVNIFLAAKAFQVN